MMMLQPLIFRGVVFRVYFLAKNFEHLPEPAEVEIDW